ncbi:MAG: uracil phosphoribosyltransferase [Candidatus Yonathbacteria bacterium]|nr:uracil phosphoribosyltransferase [Candidatus Yonathbacteria bacterium]
MTSPFITLRNRKSTTKEFRDGANEVSRILAKEVSRHVVSSKKIILVPILRAGLALLPSFIEKFSEARVGFIGLKRNEKTLKPKAYYQNLPRISKSDVVIVLDPMLATGGSAVAGIATLIEAGAREEDIVFVGVISAPEGIANVQKNFPRVRILCAAYDKKLDKKGYIVPGLGDFGDRYFA